MTRDERMMMRFQETLLAKIASGDACGPFLSAVVDADGEVVAEETNAVDKSILEKWYGSKPGGSLHDACVVEIEKVFA